MLIFEKNETKPSKKYVSWFKKNDSGFWVYQALRSESVSVAVGRIVARLAG